MVGGGGGGRRGEDAAIGDMAPHPWRLLLLLLSDNRAVWRPEVLECCWNLAGEGAVYV